MDMDQFQVYPSPAITTIDMDHHGHRSVSRVPFPHNHYHRHGLPWTWISFTCTLPPQSLPWTWITMDTDQFPMYPSPTITTMYMDCHGHGSVSHVPFPHSHYHGHGSLCTWISLMCTLPPQLLPWTWIAMDTDQFHVYPSSTITTKDMDQFQILTTISLQVENHLLKTIKAWWNCID